MNNIFFISDTHFGHENILKFKNTDNSHLRTFDDVYHMDQHMIDCWNAVVQPTDKVYHLGDLAFGNNLDIMKFLRGTKILIRGNHDRQQLSNYAKYFKDVRGVEHRGEWKMTLSHIPIHPDSVKDNWTNVHGHLHCRVIPDSRYFNVSVERINYTPIELGELKERIKNASTN